MQMWVRRQCRYECVTTVSAVRVYRKIGHVDPETGFVTMKGEKGKGKGRMKVKKDKYGNIIVTEETAEERARRKVRPPEPRL